jgi:hypothetical protein
MRHVSPCSSAIGAAVNGFLLHAIRREPSQTSLGTAVTLSGAVLMAVALIVLVYGFLRTQRLPPDYRA